MQYTVKTPRATPIAALAMAVFAALAMPAAAAVGGNPGSVSKAADFGKEKPSRDARQVANWVLSSGDNKGGSFVIVDKSRARVYVFEPGGRLRAASPVLLGMAKGDDSAPGIGEKKLSEIPLEERTTPAGRFVAEPGIDEKGDDIVWVDYDAAVSMHRVITTNPVERRLQRLMSRTAADNRISFGCMNLPVRFYEKVLSPTVKKGETIVYVLPETRPASAVFGFRDGAAGRPLTRAGATKSGGSTVRTTVKPDSQGPQLHFLDGA
jgi:hypothetical protein